MVCPVAAASFPQKELKSVKSVCLCVNWIKMKLLILTATIFTLMALAYSEDALPADVELIEPINSASPGAVAEDSEPGDDKKTAKRGAYLGIGIGYGYGSYSGGYYPYYGHYYDHYYPHYGYGYGYGYPYWGGYYW